MTKLSSTLLLPFLLALTIAQPGPYASFHTTGYIPFTDTTAITLPIDWSSKPKVDVTVNSFASTARLFRPDVDTGTCGFLFSSKDLPDWNATTEALETNKGWQFLSSSDLLYTGHWVTRDIYFNPRNSATRIKATVPILAVTKKVKCTTYSVSVDTDTCPTTPEWEDNNPGSVRVMGVGFGREDDGQPKGTPDKNAFINIQSIAGQSMTTYLQGYTIDSYGINVGLTNDNTLGMTFQDLPARNPNPVGSRVPSIARDWASLRSGCISFDDGASCYAGEVLLDTGIANSSMRVPLGVTLPRDAITKVLNDGTIVRVNLGDPAIVTERFTAGTGAATGVTPDLAFAYNSARGNFFNTGRHAYRAWKTAYDSVNGRYGIGTV
ncbi:hypothetical protein V8F20_005978 [Naviculisporaceae sp. PSN 640]